MNTTRARLLLIALGLLAAVFALSLVPEGTPYPGAMPHYGAQR